MAATREDDGDVEARLRARWAADGRKNPDVEDALRRVGIAKARERRCVRAARDDDDDGDERCANDTNARLCDAGR
jgi:hypothetical protein